MTDNTTSPQGVMIMHGHPEFKQFRATIDAQGANVEELDARIKSQAAPSQEPVAFTNNEQLGYLKDPRYAVMPMAMWSKPLHESVNVALYTAPPDAAQIDELKDKLSESEIIMGNMRKHIDDQRFFINHLEQIAERRDEQLSEYEQIMGAGGLFCNAPSQEVLDILAKAQESLGVQRICNILNRGCEAAPSQEPVAWMSYEGKTCSAHWRATNALDRQQDEYYIPLYTHPAPSQEPVAIAECKIVHGHMAQFLNRTRYGMDTLKNGDKLYTAPPDAAAQETDWRSHYLKCVDGHNLTLDELRSAGEQIAKLEEALRLIAAPPRPDGTYNRCREACEVLAREALKND